MLPRIAAAVAALVMGGVFVGPVKAGLLIAVFLTVEVIQLLLFADMDRRPVGPPLSRTSYIIFMFNSLAGASSWSLMALLLWQHPDPMVNFVGVVYLCGGFVNTIVVHADHLPLGITNALPMSLVLLLMPLRDLQGHALTSVALFSIGAAVLLIVYYGFVMLDYNRMTRNLYRSRQAAIRSDETKSRFLAGISHDMRTPLNAILGAAQLLQSGDPASKQQSVAMLEQSALALQTIIDDAMAVAESACTLGKFNPVTAHLARELSQTLTAFQQTPGAMAKRRIVVDSSVPELAVFDPVMLRRCLGRIMAQISLDMPDGTLDFTAMVHPVPLPATLQITVDGLPGTGLDPSGENLGAAQALAKTMNGRLEISDDGTVHLYLPVTLVVPQEGRETPASAQEAAQPLRVLVVDDIATNRFIVLQLLKNENVLPVEADSGANALIALRTHVFDLILLDMNMPQMSGSATFEAIRGAGETWSQVPVIALTANALAEQRSEYLALGLSGYVAKPVDRSLLMAEIWRVLKHA